MNRDPTMDEIVQAIQIYSGLSSEEIEQVIKQEHERSSYNSALDTALVYGTLTYHIPTHLYPDVCELGRKLRDDEVTVLRIRDKGTVDITVNLTP